MPAFRYFDTPQPTETVSPGAPGDIPEYALSLTQARITWTWNTLFDLSDEAYPNPLLVGFTIERANIPELHRFDLAAMMPGMLQVVVAPDAPPVPRQSTPRYGFVGIIYDANRLVTAISTKDFHLDVMYSMPEQPGKASA